MRRYAASVCLAGIIAIVAASSVYAQTATVVVEAGDVSSLKEKLLTLAEARLSRDGLSIDRRHTWMTLSARLPSTDRFEVRQIEAAAVPPTLPLKFLVRAASPAGESIEATLAVSLLREVPVATRRLRKGSPVGCDDFSMQRRPQTEAAKQPLPLSCDSGAAVVALRDIASGDVVRGTDIGSAPPVLAGRPVRVNVVSGKITITTDAIALVDARIGDSVDVRLEHPARVLRTRVMGPASVQLVDGAL